MTGAMGGQFSITDESDWQAQLAKTIRSLTLHINAFSFFLIQTIFNAAREVEMWPISASSPFVHITYIPVECSWKCLTVGREKKTADSVICCLRWNPLDALDYDFMEPCHVVAGRKLPCLFSVYYMPDTLLDAENSMTDTRASAFREFSVVLGRQRGKHRDAALIYQMSKSWELQRIVAEVQEWRPIGFLFSQKKHQVNLSGS